MAQTAMPEQKRIITFDMPKDYGEYRAVCRFGYNYFNPYQWYVHLENSTYQKKWPWSKPSLKWVEIDSAAIASCNIESIDSLKRSAESFYRDTIVFWREVAQKAMDLK